MAEDTGTIQDPAVQVIFNKDNDRLQESFVNDSGGDLTPGMEVIFKNNGTIDKRTLGSQYPIGIVIVGAANAKRATVRLYGTILMNAVATGGNLPNSGTHVVPNGLIDATYGTPEVVAATVENYVSMVIIKGANQNLPVKVLVLNTPIQLNPAP